MTAGRRGGGSRDSQPVPISGGQDVEPLTWFGAMIDHCYDYALAAQKAGRPIVGILCEYTPRELILAAGAVPVCLCGGSVETIPPAEEELPSNLCPLIKSTFGYHATRSNPFLEMADLVVAETTCDGKKKMYELMSRTRPMYVLELPHKAGDADAAAHWLAEVRKLKDHLQQRFSVTISNERLREAIALMNRERALRRQLAELMTADDPPITGRELLEFKSSISGIEADLAQYERAAATYRARRDARNAAKVRVLMTGVPMVHGAERVLEIIEDHGGLVVCMENCTGLKPIAEDVDATRADPLEAIAEKYFHLPCSVQTGNRRRLETLTDWARRFRAQGVIELVWHACLTYDVESALVKDWCRQQHLPYLKIDTDYSPTDSARIATRVEALFETVRAARVPEGSAP
ncbi:MAG: 2-hydroxyacyl-CoA dehydratase family protein [Phycisphaerae bacterium]|nr:2-hydroxyacyl-CoA dehydratase family protein [Phycisphaerae bacterium]